MVTQGNILTMIRIFLLSIGYLVQHGEFNFISELEILFIDATRRENGLIALQHRSQCAKD